MGIFRKVEKSETRVIHEMSRVSSHQQKVEVNNNNKNREHVIVSTRALLDGDIDELYTTQNCRRTRRTGLEDLQSPRGFIRSY